MSTTIRRVTAIKALMNALRGTGATGVSVGERLGAVPRMLSAGFGGRYPYLDRGRIALAAVALLYVVSPIDVMPEAIFAVLGLGDDALVAAWLAGAVLSEADTFLAWERAQARGEDDVRVVRGEVVDDRPANPRGREA
jgi:uncharacterized membrane protein YkvA (DUF1232 family)